MMSCAYSTKYPRDILLYQVVYSGFMRFVVVALLLVTLIVPAPNTYASEYLESGIHNDSENDFKNTTTYEDESGRTEDSEVLGAQYEENEDFENEVLVEQISNGTTTLLTDTSIGTTTIAEDSDTEFIATSTKTSLLGTSTEQEIYSETYGDSADMSNSSIADSPDEKLDEFLQESIRISAVGIQEGANEGRHQIDTKIYSFSANECVAMGDNTYHCTTQAKSDVNQLQVVYSAPDENGIHQIYVRTSNGLLQVTDSDHDDRAPYLDQISNSVVWHRQIDGRYQIMSYDLRTGSKEQLTILPTNHMEPARSGDITVWQVWKGGSWQIQKLRNNSISTLTDTAVHEISPRVHGGYIIWISTGREGGRVLKVFDSELGITKTVPDPGIGRVSNPRSVLVFDSQLENGDIIVHGYDPVTGEVLQLSATPSSKPVNIPKRDPAETGIVTQSKAQPKNSGAENNNNATNDDFDGTLEADAYTLDLRNASTSSAEVTVGDDIGSYDIIVESINTTTEADIFDNGNHD